MPGSGLRAFTMVEQEADLVDPFFDSEDDEVPVDMEMVYEAMKHVPLPDIDYPEQDDPISGDHRLAEPLSGRTICATPDPVVCQSLLKRKVATEETAQPKKRGGGTSRVPKRLKVELQSNGISSNSIPLQTTKVEIVVGSVTAAAAKVAAEVPPDVVTTGTVAETGPRPDFSLWTVKDDLILKSAMEAGAAMEALARGAMPFSRRFSVKELRERWRALLYDPEIAEEAALRMAEAEYASNYCAAKSPEDPKDPKELVRKRRANSMRTLFYKRSKGALEDVAVEGVAPGSANDAAAGNMDGACEASNVVALDDNMDSAVRPLADAVIRASVDSGSLPSKEGHSPELEDGTLSQMYSLLAAGGIKAVIAALPAGMSVSAPDHEVGDIFAGVPQNGVNDLHLLTDLAKSVGSKQVTAVLHENGQISGSDSTLFAAVVQENGQVSGSDSTLVATVVQENGQVSGSDSRLVAAVLHAENGQLFGAGSLLDTPMAAAGSILGTPMEAGGSRASCGEGMALETSAVTVSYMANGGEGMAMETSAVIVSQMSNSGEGIAKETSAVSVSQSCLRVEEGSASTVAADIKVDATLPPSDNCLELPRKEADGDVAVPRVEDCERPCVQPVDELHPAAISCVQLMDGVDPTSISCVQAVDEVHQATTFCVQPVDEVHPAVNGDFEEQVAQEEKDQSEMLSQLADSLNTGVNKIETFITDDLAEGAAEGTLFSVALTEEKVEQPCATSLVSAVDHREIPDADTRVLYSVADKNDGSTLGPNESADLLEPCAGASLTEEMEEAETIEALYRECCCGGEYDATEQIEESRDGDICYCTEPDEANDLHLPSVLIGESCTGDLDCPYLSDCCIPLQSTSAPGTLQPAVCTLNTEDSDVPSLEDCLLPSPSQFSPPSQQGENLGYADSPCAGAGGDEHYYGDEDADENVHADCEYMCLSPRQQGVSSTAMEPVISNSLYGTSTDPAVFGLPLDTTTAMDPGNHVDGARGSMLPVEEIEKLEAKCTDAVGNAGFCAISASASGLGPYPFTPAQTLHQQAPQPEHSGGRLQNANNFGFTDWQTSTFVPVSGDRETDASPSVDLQTVVPPDTQVTNGEAPESVQDPIEEEEESDEEMARFSDIEAMMLDMDLDVADDDYSARAESREIYMRHGRSVVRSEQAATASMHRTLNLHGALATLYGLRSKFYITQPEVLLGRATTDNIVDIDLGKEGRANKVSRQQANIKLKDDGIFYLRNLGRRSLTVNNKSVEKGERAILGSNCLIEVGGVRFIFEINRKLVQDHISRRCQQ